MIGLSYIHTGTGHYDLQYNLNDVSARYDKDVIVVETAFPFTLADDMAGKHH
jgi:arabinogalactan endo-1,4-beta-galactosidase